MKYQRLTPSGCKHIAIWKSEFVAKTQFLLADFSVSINAFSKKIINVDIFNQAKLFKLDHPSTFIGVMCVSCHKKIDPIGSTVLTVFLDTNKQIVKKPNIYLDRNRREQKV